MEATTAVVEATTAVVDIEGPHIPVLSQNMIINAEKQRIKMCEVKNQDNI